MSVSQAPEQLEGKPHGRWLLAACMGIVISVAIAHGGAVGNGFVSFDDPRYVTEVAQVRAGLTWRGVTWAFAFGGRATYFHPVTWLSLMLDAELFGVEPWGFHLVNVILHALNATLLLLLLWRTTSRPRAAFAAVLLWAVHPLTVEAVTWVAERKAVLSTAFGLAAMLFHVSHARRPSAWKTAGAAVFVVLGVLAKAAVVVIPALLLVLDLWPLGRLGLARASPEGNEPRASRWTLVAEKLPALALALGATAFGMASLEAVYRGVLTAPGSLVGSGLTVETSIAHRVATGVGEIPRYLAAALWPTRLGVFHPYPSTIEWGSVVLGVAIVLGATGATVAVARRWPAGLGGWCWFLVTLAPYLGLYQAGLWPGWAERFAYLPLAGLAIVTAFGAADLATRIAWGRWMSAGALAAVTVALILATRAQVTVWRDSISLYANATRAEPGVALLHAHHGKALLQAGRSRDARVAFERAIAIEPSLPWANAELASMRFAEGDNDGARRHFLAALDSWRLVPEVLTEYARFLDATGDPVRARVFRRRFIDATASGVGGAALRPRAIEQLILTGRDGEAEELLRLALAEDPRSARANAQLGTLLMRRGSYADAERHLLAALDASPDMPEVLFNLAEVLRASGQLARALPYYERFAALAPAQYEVQRRQALGYLGRGDR